MLYNCRIRVYRATDLAGQWVAENTTFDIVSQGNSPDHALQMVNEATLLVLQHDLETDRDPYTRGKSEPDIVALAPGVCAIYHDVVFNVVKRKPYEIA